MLEARIGSKRLASGQVLLRDVAISAAPGDIVAVLGASGTGKTTALRILLGLDRRYDGSVRCDAARVGAVFQEPRLLPWRTIGDNIRLVVPRGRPMPDLPALLEAVALPAGVAALYPRQVSLGMARRAALARAMATAPDLLILDEPFASLDPGTSAPIAARLAAAAQAGAALVIALHDVVRAAALATRIVVLAGRPATSAYTAGLAAPEDRPRVLAELVRRFPFLTEPGPAGDRPEAATALPPGPGVG